MCINICQYLMFQAEDVRDAAWGCDWVGTPVSLQRCLVFIIATANKEFTLKAGKFVPVCNRTMMNVRTLTLQHNVKHEIMLNIIIIQLFLNFRRRKFHYSAVSYCIVEIVHVIYDICRSVSYQCNEYNWNMSGTNFHLQSFERRTEYSLLWNFILFFKHF